MLTLQDLYLFVGLNLLIVGILFLLARIRRNFSGWSFFLLVVVWMVFSWYYELRMADHLPSRIYHDHGLFAFFLSAVYGLGQYISILSVFFAAVVGIGQLLDPDIKTGTKKRGKVFNHSPLPLWVAGMAVGLLSALVLRQGLIPQLGRLTSFMTDLIYRQLFHMQPGFPASYVPAAGIAAGTFVALGCSFFYRRSAVPLIWFLPLVFIPVLTAVLAPLVEFAGSILVFIIIFTAFVLRENSLDYSVRSGVPFVILSLAVGGLSGFYFYMNDVVLVGNEKTMTLAGGFIAGITIAALCCRSYRSQDSVMNSLFFLGLIPFCTPGFSFALGYVLSLIGSVFILFGSMGGTTKKKDPEYLRFPDGTEAVSTGDGKYRFSERLQTVEIEETEPGSDIYRDGWTGRTYEKNGIWIHPQG